MGVLINLIEQILLQCMNISNHHAIHFKYITIFFSYGTIKFKKENYYSLTQQLLSSIIQQTTGN